MGGGIGQSEPPVDRRMVPAVAGIAVLTMLVLSGAFPGSPGTSRPGVPHARLAPTIAPRSEPGPVVPPATTAPRVMSDAPASPRPMNSLLTSVPAGSGPLGLAYERSRGEVLVTDAGASYLTILNDSSDSVVATVPVGSWPFAVVSDAGQNRIFVANYGSQNVSVINPATNAVTATVLLHVSPEGVAYDAARGEVFATGYDGARVDVINDTNDTVAASIPVGGDPVGVAYDAGHGEVFVASYNQSNGPSFVSIIDDATNHVVAVVPVGLARPGQRLPAHRRLLRWAARRALRGESGRGHRQRPERHVEHRRGDDSGQELPPGARLRPDERDGVRRERIFGQRQRDRRGH